MPYLVNGSIDFWGFSFTIGSMARPKKEERLLLTIPLRIMLTAEQRELIERAASASGSDMTAWARPILLAAAKRELAKASGVRSAGIEDDGKSA